MQSVLGVCVYDLIDFLLGVNLDILPCHPKHSSPTATRGLVLLPSPLVPPLRILRLAMASAEHGDSAGQGGDVSFLGSTHSKEAGMK